MTWLSRDRLCRTLECSTRPREADSAERRCSWQTQRSRVLHTECTATPPPHRWRPGATAPAEEAEHLAYLFQGNLQNSENTILLTQVFVEWRLGKQASSTNPFNLHGTQSRFLEGNVSTQKINYCVLNARTGGIQECPKSTRNRHSTWGSGKAFYREAETSRAAESVWWVGRQRIGAVSGRGAAPRRPGEESACATPPTHTKPTPPLNWEGAGPGRPGEESACAAPPQPHTEPTPHWTERGWANTGEGMQHSDGDMKPASKQRDSLSASMGCPGGPGGKNLPTSAGAQVRPLVWEDSTCCRGTKPMCHNCWSA